MHFIRTESSLPYSQQLATSHCYTLY